jgi:hypothetical protein
MDFKQRWVMTKEFTKTKVLESIAYANALRL